MSCTAIFSLFDLNRSHLDNAQLTQLPTNFLDMKGAFIVFSRTLKMKHFSRTFKDKYLLYVLLRCMRAFFGDCAFWNLDA